MRLPFTIDQFVDVFGRYNLAVWPARPTGRGLWSPRCGWTDDRVAHPRSSHGLERSSHACSRYQRPQSRGLNNAARPGIVGPSAR